MATAREMNAVVKTRVMGPGAELRRLPIPSPKAGQVLVKVIKAAICGSDRLRYDWEPSLGPAPFMDELILGHEASGIVEQVGPNVDRVTPGQKVAVETHVPCGHCIQCLKGDFHVCANLRVLGVKYPGCFAQYLLLPQACVVPVPEEMPLEQAVLLEPLGVAYHALSKVDVSGNSILISGCGPIGLMAVRLARALGAACVVAVAKHPPQAEWARNSGADIVVPPDAEAVEQAVRKAGGGYGVGAALDFAGSRQSVLNVFKSVRKAGEVVLVGAIKPFEFDFDKLLCKKELAVHGQHGRRMYSTWVEVMALLAAGRVDISDLITADLPLADFAKGFDLLRKPEQVKILLSPWPEQT